MSDFRDVSEPEDQVELVLAECLTAAPRERSAAFERACSTHPELARDLRDRWRALAAMGLVDGDASEGEFPEQLGDFRLVRRLGGGGMGVVYLARQLALGRDVALKLIRPEQLYFPRARERFRREAEAIALLAHPGIVPIHAVGEERGVPYFAMELVRGTTLAEKLERVASRAPESLAASDLYDGGSAEPGSWVDACVEIARQLADALAHAHASGVLHRDVKPSNVMLTGAGRARLIDFGLTALAGDERTTRTGAQLGTLAYMAPEQLRGANVDARADVYGLGATLYELLALQPPYRGQDALEIERAILGGRLDALRARNRRVGAELEIVCAVAMELDPARRYATAAELRDDLARLLAREAIRARPPGVVVKLARFAQRRPGLSSALAAAFVLAVATPSGLWWQARSHARELRDALEKEKLARGEAERERAAASAAEQVAASARERSAEDAQIAEQSLRFLTDLFAGISPYQQQGRGLSALELLENGTAKLDELLHDEPAAKARLQATIGKIWCDQGRYREALPLLEAAHEHERATGDERLAEADVDPTYYLAQCWLALGDTARAAPYVEDFAASPGASDDAIERANGLHLLAVLRYHERRFDDVERLVGDEQAALAGDDSPEARKTLGAALALLAQAHAVRGRSDEAIALIERATQMLRESLDEHDPQLASACSVRASLYRSRGDFAKADAAYEESVAVARRVFAGDSALLATTLHNWAILRAENGDARSARELMEEADLSFEAVFGAESRERASSLYGVGRIALQAKEYERAEEILTRAVELLARFDGDKERTARGFALQDLGICAHQRGEHALAKERFEDGFEVLSATPGGEVWAVQILTVQARCERAAGSDGAARDTYRKAIEFAGERLAPDESSFVTVRRELIALHEKLGESDRAGELREELVALGLEAPR